MGSCSKTPATGYPSPPACPASPLRPAASRFSLAPSHDRPPSASAAPVPGPAVAKPQAAKSASPCRPRRPRRMRISRKASGQSRAGLALAPPLHPRGPRISNRRTRLSWPAPRGTGCDGEEPPREPAGCDPRSPLSPATARWVIRGLRSPHGHLSPITWELRLTFLRIAASIASKEPDWPANGSLLRLQLFRRRLHTTKPRPGRSSIAASSFELAGCFRCTRFLTRKSPELLTFLPSVKNNGSSIRDVLMKPNHFSIGNKKQNKNTLLHRAEIFPLFACFLYS